MVSIQNKIVAGVLAVLVVLLAPTLFILLAAFIFHFFLPFFFGCVVAFFVWLTYNIILDGLVEHQRKKDKQNETK